MEFGKIAVANALGAVLGHSIASLKKGSVLGEADIAVLEKGGVESVYAARLDENDVLENDAASAIGAVLAGQGVTVEGAAAGRVNLLASAAGVVELDAGRINQLNQLDESLTVATLAPFERVEKGQILATVKVIPYAVPKDVLDAGLKLAGDTPLVHLRHFTAKRIGLIITQLAHTKASLIEKTERVMAERAVLLGSQMGRVSIVDHTANAISMALNSISPHHDFALIFGASAIVDRADVVPKAILQVGGEIEHLGMPVDPGNLLLLARIGDMPVVGVPTCARSLKRNGFDWVFERLLANIDVTGFDLRAMGVGGLLKEIPSRPYPRAKENRDG